MTAPDGSVSGSGGIDPDYLTVGLVLGFDNMLFSLPFSMNVAFRSAR